MGDFVGPDRRGDWGGQKHVTGVFGRVCGLLVLGILSVPPSAWAQSWVRELSIEELMQVDGISRGLAEKILNDEPESGDPNRLRMHAGGLDVP